MNEKKFICIVCPNGCELKVTEKEGKYQVEGALCKRGIKYGIKESTEPERMLTTTISISGGVHPRISVINDQEIPRDKIKECLSVLYNLKVEAPIKMGDIMVKDICGTGANILASRSMKVKKVSDH